MLLLVGEIRALMRKGFCGKVFLNLVISGDNCEDNFSAESQGFLIYAPSSPGPKLRSFCMTCKLEGEEIMKTGEDTREDR